jgi:hypothetical protein
LNRKSCGITLLYITTDGLGRLLVRPVRYQNGDVIHHQVKGKNH